MFLANYITEKTDEENIKFQSPAKTSSIHPPIYLFSPEIHTPYLAEIQPNPEERKHKLYFIEFKKFIKLVGSH